MRISHLAVIAAALALPSLGYAALAPITASQLPPVPSVVWNGPIAVGAMIPRNGGVPTYFIPNYSHLYAYTILDGHAVIVNRHTARIVQILNPAPAYPVYGYGYPWAYPGGPIGAAVTEPVAAAGALAAAPVEAAATLAGASPPPVTAPAYPAYGYGYGYPWGYPGGAPIGAAVAAPVAAAGALAAAPVEAAATLTGAPPAPVTAPAPGCQMIAGNRVCSGYMP
jgi:Protein of unknown function (DUF1236)